METPSEFLRRQERERRDGWVPGQRTKEEMPSEFLRRKAREEEKRRQQLG